MRAGQQTSQTASAKCRFINSGIDTALVYIGCKYSKELADCGEAAHQTIPKITIHPVGQTRAGPCESDDRSRIQLIDPHLVCEEPEQRRLRVFEGINVRGSISILRPSFSIEPNAQADPGANEDERNEKHGLDQVCNVEVNRFSRQITMQPWPDGGEYDAQETRANRQHNQRHGHHPRTFVRVLSGASAITEKDVDHLP